jgi:hypothetical protein
MKRELEIKGFTLEKSDKEPFYLRIFEPVKTSDEDDYSCRIHCPSLFKRDKTIFGVNEDQAYDLAIEFIKNLLGDKRIVDDKEVEIDMKRWQKS